MFIDVSISNCQYLTNANMQVDIRKIFIQIIENRMIQNLRRNVELKCGMISFLNFKIILINFIHFLS